MERRRHPFANDRERRVYLDRDPLVAQHKGKGVRGRVHVGRTGLVKGPEAPYELPVHLLQYVRFPRVSIAGQSTENQHDLRPLQDVRPHLVEEHVVYRARRHGHGHFRPDVVHDII